MALFRPAPHSPRARLALGLVVFAGAGALLVRETLAGDPEPVHLFALGLAALVGGFAAVAMARQ